MEYLQQPIMKVNQFEISDNDTTQATTNAPGTASAMRYLSTRGGVKTSMDQLQNMNSTGVFNSTKYQNNLAESIKEKQRLLNVI